MTILNFYVHFPGYDLGQIGNAILIHIIHELYKGMVDNLS